MGPCARHASWVWKNLPGFLLSGAGLELLMYGVSESPKAGWGAPADRGELAAGVVALAALVAVKLRRREPLQRLRRLRDRLFSVSNTVRVLTSIAFLGTV